MERFENHIEETYKTFDHQSTLYVIMIVSFSWHQSVPTSEPEDFKALRGLFL